MNFLKITSHLIVLTCLASLTALASPLQATGPDFAAIDAYVEAQMKDIRIPGVALGIIQGDQIVYVKGYGVADPSGRPVTPQTPFWLASLMKSVTAYLIAQLNEGRYGSVALLSPEGIAELHHPAASMGEGAKFYAMGWEVETVNGLTTLSHSGDHGNFHADMALTSDGWGIVMMTNVNGLLTAGRQSGIATGVASLLRGQQPPANEGVLGLLISLGIWSIVALQIIGMVWSLVVLRRWFQRTKPVRRLHGYLAVGWHVVLPLVVNLILAFVLTVGFPAIAPGGLSLQGFVFLYPDVGYAMVMSGVVALVWIIRTVLAYFALRTINTPNVIRGTA